jgi:hypothetical protein
MGLGKTLQSIALLAYLKSARSSKGPFCKLTSTICPVSFWRFIVVSHYKDHRCQMAESFV